MPRRLASPQSHTDPHLPYPLPLHHGFIGESLADSWLFAPLLLVRLADVPSHSDPMPVVHEFFMLKVRVGFPPFRKLSPRPLFAVVETGG